MTHAARNADRSTSGENDIPLRSGSRNVFINGRAALRFGDGGDNCKIVDGAPSVLLNGLSAARSGDHTEQECGPGVICNGSPNVLIGNKGGTNPALKPVLRFKITLPGGAPCSNQTVEILDPTGEVVHSATLDDDGCLEYNTSRWGGFYVRLANRRVVRLR